MQTDTASTLAQFSSDLIYEQIPSAARQRLVQCLVDGVACATYGATKPWARIVIDAAKCMGSEGDARLPADTNERLAPGPAALALGACCHAFEQDSLRRPSVGVHGAATVAMPVLAMAQHIGAGGREVVVAMAAGIEVMTRIGAATKHSPEKRGFHAPGLIGPFGAAVACSKLLGANTDQILRAIGIAGSFSSGLLAFSKAKSGGMVKRLHMGRAAEGGVLAAQLAARGYEGPETVIDGQFGLLDAYCSEIDPSKLTAGLGSIWESETIGFKKFPAHITSHAPVTGLETLRAEHLFEPHEIEEISVRGARKIVTHHDIKKPADIMQAQYSLPFNVARSMYQDLMDPDTLTDDILEDRSILELAKKVSLAEDDDVAKRRSWSAAVAVRLKDGRVFETTVEDWPGMPQMPFTAQQLKEKFVLLTRTLSRAEDLFAELSDIESIEDFRHVEWI